MVQSGALFVSESPWLHGVRGEGDGKLDVADRIEFEALPRLRCDRLALGRAGCAPEFRILRVRAGPRQSAAWGRLTLNHDRRSHRSGDHKSELQSPCNLVCRLLL